MTYWPGSTRKYSWLLAATRVLDQQIAYSRCFPGDSDLKKRASGTGADGPAGVGSFFPSFPATAKRYTST